MASPCQRLAAFRCTLHTDSKAIATRHHPTRHRPFDRSPVQVSRCPHDCVRSYPARLKSGRTEDMSDRASLSRWVFDWAIRRERCRHSVSHHLHFCRRLYRGVWLRCFASRDLAGLLRHCPSLCDWIDCHRFAASTRMAQPAEGHSPSVFGFIPRILAASLIAFWAGEFANSYTMARMKLLTNGRMLWTRTIGSTVVGQAVDTTLVITSYLLPGTDPVSHTRF